MVSGPTVHILQFLHDGRYLQCNLNKGVMAGLLERVPVWRVEHGQPGLLGAVVWYQQNRKE
ncbi:MAG: glucokinase [Sphingomonadales bacterium]|nr:glucokinase [Sphingomonadales bacterium]